MYVRYGWSHSRLIAPIVHAFAISITLLVVSPVPSAAQPLAVDSGSLVRIVAPGFRGKGIVSRQNSETLTLAADNRGDPLLIPWTSIRALSVSERRSAREGALLGSRIGSAVGIIVAFYGLAYSLQGPPADEWSDTAYLSAIFGGTGVGALIGAYRPGSRWQRVNIRTSGR